MGRENVIIRRGESPEWVWVISEGEVPKERVVKLVALEEEWYAWYEEQGWVRIS